MAVYFVCTTGLGMVPPLNIGPRIYVYESFFSDKRTRLKHINILALYMDTGYKASLL
jgi:hypothetical protein